MSESIASFDHEDAIILLVKSDQHQRQCKSVSVSLCLAAGLERVESGVCEVESSRALTGGRQATHLKFISFNSG